MITTNDYFRMSYWDIACIHVIILSNLFGVAYNFYHNNFFVVQFFVIFYISNVLKFTLYVHFQNSTQHNILF